MPCWFCCRYTVSPESDGRQVLEISDLKLDDAAEYKCQIGDRETVGKLTVEEGAYVRYLQARVLVLYLFYISCLFGCQQHVVRKMYMYMCMYIFIYDVYVYCMVLYLYTYMYGTCTCMVHIQLRDCVIVSARRPPKIDLDKVPRELTVKAGKDVEIEVPYVGKRSTSLLTQQALSKVTC